MFDEIILKVILTVVGFMTTGVLGYLVAKIKNYKKRDTNQEEALKCLLRSNITSKYYVYNELKEIPLYEKENARLKDKLKDIKKILDADCCVENIYQAMCQ